MVLRREAVEARLKELAVVMQELLRYENTTDADWSDLSRRWIIERGLIAAASLVLDIADHILAGHFGLYPDAYEESLAMLRDRQVISAQLYGEIQGLGGLRNVLIHQYTRIDPRLVWSHYQKGVRVFPRFADEILAWLDTTELRSEPGRAADS